MPPALRVHSGICNSRWHWEAWEWMPGYGGENSQGGSPYISTAFGENNPCTALCSSISCKSGKVVSD